MLFTDCFAHLRTGETAADPRIPDLKSRRRYSFGNAAANPSLEPLIAGRINTALIRAHWPEILRVAASIHTGTVAASLSCGSSPPTRGKTASPRRCASWAGWNARCSPSTGWGLWNTPSDRPGTQQGRNTLQPGAGCLHPSPRRDRDRTYENQQDRAPGLNLLVTAIILWNTRYLERAVAALCQTGDVPEQLLAHLSPLDWEHVYLTGDCIWSAERPVTESHRDGFRPLRAAPDTARKAA
jgi:Tn3 transposase DDE domain-containing protein